MTPKSKENTHLTLACRLQIASNMFTLPLPSPDSNPKPQIKLKSAIAVVNAAAGPDSYAVEPVGDTLVVAGEPALIRRLTALIDSARERIVPLQYAPATQLAALMPGDISVDEPTNRLIITSTSEEELTLLEDMARALDAGWVVVH